MNKFLRKALLVVGGVILSSTAWAQANTTVVGNTNNTTTWWSAFSDYYTIEPNQTLKLKFKNYSDKALNFHNWAVAVTTDAERGASGYSEYVVLRADNFAWQVWDVKTTGEGKDHTWYTSLSSNYNWGTFTQDMDNSTVDMTIKRVGATVTIHAQIAGGLGTSYYEEFILDCGDGTQNIRAFLTTQNGHLVIDNDATHYGTSLIGKEDNTTAWWSAFSPYYTIEPNKTLTLDFYNYSGKALNFHNWLAFVTNDAERGAAGYTEYVALRADNYAWQTGTVIINGKEYYKNTADEKEPTEKENGVTEPGVTHSWYKSLTSYFNWDTFKEAMNGAHVILTISRGGNVANIHADITGSDNNKYYEDFVLPCGDDGAANLRVFLTVENAHLLLDESKTTITDTEVTGTVSASGYNTFSSIFPLDLSTISGAKAYAATSINANNAVELEEATGKVPAEYGLMVQGVANAKFTVKPTSDATAEIENNMLVGMPFGGQVTKATEGFNYVFGYTDPKQPGFYQVDGVLPTLQAGRAYLYTTQDLLATSTDGAPALTISLGDDEATGIRSIDNGKLTIDNVYYDLSGRRVAQPTKGVYVVNGKKVVIK